jgi:hypothetical protein
MATRAQIVRLGQRIEALGQSHGEAPRLGIIWRYSDETEAEARRRHTLSYPDDDAENLHVISWEPMTEAEWEEEFCVSADHQII